MATITTVRAQQGDTVDLICMRHLGYTANAVEAVYRANPGLAARGPVLPIGTVVVLPALTTATPTTRSVQLWD